MDPLFREAIRGACRLRVLSLISCLCAFDVVAQAPDKSGVKPSVISLPSGPGSIEGLGESFEPQLNTGASSYSVGVELPPGRAGFQPTVTLSYNSGLGNSCVGIGWNLAFPDIRRQTDKGFPQYDGTDTFLFQGEELVPLVDDTYRCENETGFQRFRMIDSDGDGVLDAWEMTERNGVRHFFGRYRGAAGRWSAVLHSDWQGPPNAGPFDRTYCWALDQSIDLHGNRIEYHYERGIGKLYPWRITYAHLGDNHHEVSFQYGVRPDVFDDYRPTFTCRIDRRLEWVVVRSRGELVRSYGLEYEHRPDDFLLFSLDEQRRRRQSFDLGVSVLKRVTQYGRSPDLKNHLPPLILFYSYFGNTLEEAEVRGVRTPDGDLPALDLGDPSGHVQIADVNADGLPDLFSTKPVDVTGVPLQQVMLNRGLDSGGQLRFDSVVTVATQSTLNLSAKETSLTDADGDGVVDYVQLESLDTVGDAKRLLIFRNRNDLSSNHESPQGFLSSFAPGPELIQDPPRYLSLGDPLVRQMDLNFDKLSDFLFAEPDGAALSLRGFYRSRQGEWTEFNHLTTSIPSSHTFRPVRSPLDDIAVHVADMNGDRIQDYVALTRNDSGALSVAYWNYCALGRWASTEVPMVRANGDTMGARGHDLRDYFLQDFTGDGLADLLYVDGGGGGTSRLVLRVNIAGKKWSEPLTKTGLPPYRPRDRSEPTSFRTADLNGNGSTDLIWRNRGFASDTWQWLDLMPDAGKPNLLTTIDNSIGKVTEIVYGNAHEDYLGAWDREAPWRTKLPFPVQVVRQIRVRNGYDLNGDHRDDTYVTDFRYRDAYYDGFEREFRGFAFAERIDRGDDFVWNPESARLERSEGWDFSKTPTGQVSGPSLVTRYRFHTGAPDGIDNDEAPGPGVSEGLVDEVGLLAGREEECLKGKQLLEEKIDPKVLHLVEASSIGATSRLEFDVGCAAASKSGNLYESLTPDHYVYTRARQYWGVRRLYRPREPVLQRHKGSVEPDSFSPQALIPQGRFEGRPVMAGNGRSVSFSFIRRLETDVIEANGLLVQELGYERRPPKLTRVSYDYDDYGNPILENNEGIVGGDYDDERRIVTTYAHGGAALSLWIVDRSDTIHTTDEAGAFVNKTTHYYDGDAFVGVMGRIEDRALLHRVEQFAAADTSIQASRKRYDRFGNAIEIRDPNFGTRWEAPGGHFRRITYDGQVAVYPTQELAAVGEGVPPLVTEVRYDLSFGTVVESKDWNGNQSFYEYDGFTRLVSILKPYDVPSHPTLLYEYVLSDPFRNTIYHYDPSGRLTTSLGKRDGSAVLTHSREGTGGGSYTTGVLVDGADKTIGEISEGERAGMWIAKNAKSANLRGQLSGTWLPYRVTSDRVPGHTDIWAATGQGGREELPPASENRTIQYFDPVGREIRTSQPAEIEGADASRTETHIFPFEVAELDENDLALGSPTLRTPIRRENDGLGRLIAVTETIRINDDAADSKVAEWRSAYRYDLNDKLIEIADSQNNTNSFHYDGLERLLRLDDPNRGRLEFQYDDASNLVESLDAKQQKIQYRYDGLNRLKYEDYIDGSLPVSRFPAYDPNLPLSEQNRPDVVYFYDVLPKALIPGGVSESDYGNLLGQFACVWDHAGFELFSYDQRGRRVRTSRVFQNHLPTGPSPVWQTVFHFDSLDRIVKVIYPDRDSVTYDYGRRNLIERIGGNEAADLISGIEYTASAQISEIHFGNGVVTSRRYDPRLRLRNLKVESPMEGRLMDYAYDYDRSSNVTRIEDRRADSVFVENEPRLGEKRYRYDDLYRLIESQRVNRDGAVVEKVRFEYDQVGNLLTETEERLGADGRRSQRARQLIYGGGLGTFGRAVSDGVEPGPHVLSSIKAGEPRLDYEYDRSGNLEKSPAGRLRWDFKDRVFSFLGDDTLTEYVYDYSDRRVLKVRRKGDESGGATAEGGEVAVTQYVNKYFEVQPDGGFVKYLWSGDLRLGDTKSAFRSQTATSLLVELREGWNLVGGLFGKTFEELFQDSGEAVESAFGFVAEGGVWRRIEGREAFLDGPVWLKAFRDARFLMDRTVQVRNVAAGANGVWVAASPEWTLGDVQRLAEPEETWLWNAGIQQWENLMAVAQRGRFGDAGDSHYIFVGGEVNGMDPRLATGHRLYHQDHLGSLEITTDSEGRLVNRSSFSPFGKQRVETEDPKNPVRYGYIDHEEDRETGFVYLNARYYDPNMRRFIRADVYDEDHLDLKLNIPQALNAYSYAANNPLRNRDTSGELIETFFDVASFMLAANDFLEKPSLLNGTAMILDAAAILIPGVPGGAGYGLKAAGLLGKHAGKAVKMKKAIEVTKDANSIAKGYVSAKENGMSDKDALLMGVAETVATKTLKKSISRGATRSVTKRMAVKNKKFIRSLNSDGKAVVIKSISETSKFVSGQGVDKAKGMAKDSAGWAKDP